MNKLLIGIALVIFGLVFILSGFFTKTDSDGDLKSEWWVKRFCIDLGLISFVAGAIILWVNI